MLKNTEGGIPNVLNEMITFAQIEKTILLYETNLALRYLFPILIHDSFE